MSEYFDAADVAIAVEDAEVRSTRKQRVTNQYALGYKAGLEAAVNACRRVAVCWPNNFSEARYAKHAAYECAEFIAALPVPEVQWRDLTDDEILGCLLKWRQGEYELQIARAVIAKWKDKNGTN